MHPGDHWIGSPVSMVSFNSMIVLLPSCYRGFKLNDDSWPLHTQIHTLHTRKNTHINVHIYIENHSHEVFEFLKLTLHVTDDRP